MSKLDKQELNDLVAWADSDGPVVSGQAVTGAEADRMADEALRMAGRPSLGHSRATGEGRSPRRQVRLPQELNAELDRYARDEQTTASEIIRLAVSEYLGRHQGTLTSA